jgi:hypothetical protein
MRPFRIMERMTGSGVGDLSKVYLVTPKLYGAAQILSKYEAVVGFQL